MGGHAMKVLGGQKEASAGMWEGGWVDGGWMGVRVSGWEMRMEEAKKGGKAACLALPASAC